MSGALSDADLQSILKFTLDLARKAGDVILEGSDAIRSTSKQGNPVDLVTEYDIKVEDLIKAETGRAYPAFKFIGEESFVAGSTLMISDEPTFCVDPIDGTTNFVHGFPFSCVSIALICNRRPILGVIYNPFLDHLYYGTRGKGSYLIRGKSAPLKLPLSKPEPLPSLSRALVCVEWGATRYFPMVNHNSDSFLRLAADPSAVKGGRMAHGIRSLGSAALNFAMVAQGGLDMYWETGTWIWDICAGVVIAQEAGCAFSGSHAAFRQDNSFEVSEDVLLGRRYLIIRCIAATEHETTLQAQQRIAKEFYETVEEFEPFDPATVVVQVQ